MLAANVTLQVNVTSQSPPLQVNRHLYRLLRLVTTCCHKLRSMRPWDWSFVTHAIYFGLPSVSSSYLMGYDIVVILPQCKSVSCSYPFPHSQICSCPCTLGRMGPSPSLLNRSRRDRYVSILHSLRRADA
jgi:hypothetical protein